MISQGTTTGRISATSTRLEIAERLIDGVVFVDLAGWLVAGESQTLCCRAVHQLIERGLTNVVINLADVDKIDAAGLGAIACSYRAILRSGGILKLLGLSPLQMQLMTLTKLATVFEISCEEETALRSPFPKPSHGLLCDPGYCSITTSS